MTEPLEPQIDATAPVADPNDTPEHRQAVADALRVHAEQMGTLDPISARQDPTTAEMALERARLAAEAADAVARGVPEPFRRGTWGGQTNFECCWEGCHEAHLSERSAWIHGLNCTYRVAPTQPPRTTVGGIT